MSLIICALLAVALAEDPLRAVLKSPKAALNLYSSFKADNHLAFAAGEDRMRFKLFLNSAEQVADFNEDPTDTAHYVLNMFSSMTEEETKQYEGLNATEAVEGPAPALQSSKLSVPSSVLWTNTGGVTEVKNQASCGSCWAFAATAAAETYYWAKTGVLRNLAEQEYLDCAYENVAGKDGCQGGWMNVAYSWSSRNGGRLASQIDYPYTQRDSVCLGNRKTNALVGASLVGSTAVARGETANIAALANGPVAVAIKTTPKFHSYGNNIMKDETCPSGISHAITLVGYTSTYVVAKNSWGNWWGDSGFIRFTRGFHNCNLWNYSVYPVFQKTRRTDRNRSDAATSYRPSNDGGDDEVPNPDCKDISSSSYCASKKAYCRVSASWIDWSKTHCAKTCDMCECPRGTVRCNDGVCRHEHMCH